MVARLHADGYQVLYHDPLIPSFEHAGLKLESSPLTAELLAAVDA